MPSVLILLVCKHPDRLITDTITLSGILSHQSKNNKNIYIGPLDNRLIWTIGQFYNWTIDPSGTDKW